MNRAQEKLTVLLDEVSAICKENGLDMFLFTNTALAAYKTGVFEQTRYEINVIMLWKDAVAFKNIIEERQPEGRKVESLFSNPDFGNVAFRYVDTNTTYINKKDNLRAKELGLAVNIWPLMSRTCERVKGFRGRSLLGKARYLLAERTEAEEKRRKINKMTDGIIKLQNGESIGADDCGEFLDVISEIQSNATLDDTLYFRRFSTVNKKSLPDGLFKKTIFVEFEGRRHRIPEDVDAFFEAQFGENWDIKRLKRATVPHRYDILDENLPYEKYLSYLNKNGMGEYVDKQMYFRQNEVLKNCNATVDGAWNIVLRTAARINLWDQYMPVKPQIMELRAQGKWEELEEMLEDYIRIMSGMRRRKMTVYFDEDIFNIYCDIIEHNEEKIDRDELRSWIPEEHLKPVDIDNDDNGAV